MYAITFELNHDILVDTCQIEIINAYNDMKKILNSYNFKENKSFVYFGDKNVDAIDCVIAIQELTNLLPWFSVCVQDIRMLRIEESTDLRKVIDRELSKKK